MSARNKKAEALRDARPEQRVRRYLERQIAWLEQALVREAALVQLLREDRLEELAQQVMNDMRTLDTFAREQQVLCREWNDAPDRSETDRQSIRNLAQRAETLLQELHALRAPTQIAIDRALTENKHAREALRKGQAVLQGYGLRWPSDTSLDRRI